MKELIKIQSELKAPKGQTNKFGGYKYRSCEDILEAVKPLLAQNNCTLVIGDEIIEVGNRIYVKATATISNGEQSVSTSASAREAEQKKGMDDSQITGAASSYARKYALNGLFCIDDTKDADATNDHGKGQKQALQNKVAPAAATPNDKQMQIIKKVKELGGYEQLNAKTVNDFLQEQLSFEGDFMKANDKALDGLIKGLDA